MHHGMTYRYTGWKTIEDKPSSFSLQYSHQFSVLFQIFIRPMDCNGQLPLKVFGQLQQFVKVSGLHMNRSRAGDFRSEESRGGKGGVSTCRSWGAPYHSKKN